MKLRRGRTIAVGAAALAAAALLLVQSGVAGPGSLGAFFFGPKLVRAEVILDQGGTLHDYRIDRGTIAAAGATGLTLRERGGTSVTVPVAATADVRLGGVRIRPRRLRRLVGHVAIAIRDGDAPAETVRVER